MDIGDRNVGRRSRTIGHDAAFNLRYERLHRRLVQTENRRAVERNLVDVGQESGLNILQITIMIQVIGLDIGHDGDRRRQQQE